MFKLLLSHIIGSSSIIERISWAFISFKILYVLLYPMKLGLPVYLGVIGDRKSVSKRRFCYKKVLKLSTI
jgi:hypothetical protein